MRIGEKAPVTGASLRQRLGRCAGIAVLFAVGLVQAQVPANPYSYSRTDSYTYDSYGNPASSTIEPSVAEHCVLTTYTDGDVYGNRTGTSAANCSGAPASALFVSRNSTASYVPQGSGTVLVNGQAVPQVPGESVYQSTNALGQTSSATYDPRFGTPLSQTDPNNLATITQLDDWGRKLRETAPDGTSVVYYYCVLAGRGVDTSTSTNTAGCPTPASGEVPADAISLVHSEPHDLNNAKMGPFTRVYIDRKGRTLRSVTESFDGASQPSATGALIATDTTYYVTGVKQVETRPYFLSSTSSTTTGSGDVGGVVFVYDVFGRVIKVFNADLQGSQNAGFPILRASTFALTSTQYNGLSVVVTNDKQKVRTTEKDILGRDLRITDELGAQLAYQYDAFGNLVATQDALQNSITQQFDIRGHRVVMNDPDAGVLNYCYDAAGQLTAQQNANMRGSNTAGTCPAQTSNGTTATTVAQWSTVAYDALGRMTQRIDPEYSTSWIYDAYADGSACAAGIGKLCQVTTSAGVSRKYAFDSVGRQIGIRTDISSGPSFAAATGYDNVTGRVTSSTYPTGVQVNYTYTPKGFAEKLVLGTAATVNPLPATPGGTPGSSSTLAAGTVLWQSKAVNAWGQDEQQVFGNGVIQTASFDGNRGRPQGIQAGSGGSSNNVMNQAYTWNSLRNLTQRTDALGDGNTGAVTETFGYDDVQRLAQYTVSASAIPNLQRNVQLNYNALGDTLYKSDVGIYSYPTNGAGSSHPHAVTDIQAGPNPEQTFQYDANGNLASATNSKYATLSYTSFDLPDSSGGISGPSGSPHYQWNYDQDHARIKEIRTLANGDVRTTWYLNPDNAGGLSFESETNAPVTATSADPAVTSNRHYLVVGKDVIGVLVSTGNMPTLGATDMAPPALASVTLNKVEYWHQDYQDSLVATTDQTGAVTARYAYDPFGKRRYTNGTYDAAGNLVIDWAVAANNGTGRGYTQHEQLDDIGLIHMNGRIYDPAIGRMLQADPDVKETADLQNLNRYTYVLNNPFAWVDPTGYDPEDPGHRWDPCETDGYCSRFYVNPDKPQGQQSDKQGSSPSSQVTKNMAANQGGDASKVDAGGNPDKRGADAANSGTGGFSLGGWAKEVGRKLLDDFVTNNTSSEYSDHIQFTWLAKQLEGTYEKPDSSSANGMAATATVIGATLITPGGAEAKAVQEAKVANAAAHSKEFSGALSKAVEWLGDKGFKAEKETLGKFGPNAGKPIGMQTNDGKVGFRVEYDERNGAHINVWAGKEKGPHFTFGASQETVDRIVRLFQ